MADALPTPLLRWLHLSDLHIGAGDGHHRYDRRAVMDALIRDAEAMAQSQGGPPDWLFLTGDIAFSAQAEQYALPPKDPDEDEAAYQERRKGTAQYELERLAKALGISPERLLMVPGNHDVDRGAAASGATIRIAHKHLRATPQDISEYLAEPDDLASTLWPKLHPYATFASSYGAPALTPASPFWTKTLVEGPRPIVAVGLNTCLLSYDNDDGPANLALGKGQLQRAISAHPKEALLLLLMHHPPEWLSDSRDLVSILDQRPHILLCGHVHTSQGLIGNPMSGGGSVLLNAGAGHGDSGQAGEHAYLWGRLAPEGLRIWPRTFVKENHIFKAGPLKFDLDRQDSHLTPAGRLPEPLTRWLPTQAEPPSPPAAVGSESGPTDGGASPDNAPVPGVRAADRAKARARALDSLRLNLHSRAEGLARIFHEQGQVVLSDIYVELRLVPEAGLGRIAAGKERDGGRVGWEGDRTRSLEEVIRLDHDRWVLLGHPGAGKTTLLHHLVLHLLKTQERLPVFLKVGDLLDAGQRPRGLWEAITEVYGPAIAAVVQEAAEEGAAAFLLDGLDESVDLPAARRAIARVHGDAGANPVIVTSRRVGFQPLGGAFAVLQLCDLTPAQQQRLLESWIGDPALARSTLSRLQGHSRLESLIRNPLLLTLVGLLMRSGVHVPESRGKLYRDAIDVLLRCEHRPDQALPPIPEPNSVRLILADIALALHGEEMVHPLESLLDAMGRSDLASAYLERHRDHFEGPEALLDAIATRTGLLVHDRSAGQTPRGYHFAHRTFQEYLAALALARDITLEGIAAVDSGALEGLIHHPARKIEPGREPVDEPVPTPEAVLAQVDSLPEPLTLWDRCLRWLRRALGVDRAPALALTELAPPVPPPAPTRSSGARPSTVGEETRRPPLQHETLLAILEKAVVNPPGWSEVLALTCGLLGEGGPEWLVTRVAEAVKGAESVELLCRVVAEAEELSTQTVQRLLGVGDKASDWEARRDLLGELPRLAGDARTVIGLVRHFLEGRTNGNDLYFARELLLDIAEAQGAFEAGAQPDEATRREAGELARDILRAHRPEAREEAKAILEDQWIPIEGGRYMMGSEEGEWDEKPVREVTLSAYRLQKVPVTNALYERFDPGHRKKRSFADRVKDSKELDHHPVVDVTWNEAQIFAEWVGAGLPTEAQWEYAARGATGRKYPWGNGEPNARPANFNQNVGLTTPVGAYPAGASWCCALDMAGNVLEWCGDYHGHYDPTQTDNPTGPADGADRVVRGGSWFDSPVGLRGAYRLPFPPGYRLDSVGFRLAAPRSLP